MDPFLAQIIMFGGNFAPRGWALCDGQLLPIAQYQALFSLLGTTYGGDGRTTFGLPELRGRVAMHAGNGPGLGAKRLGQKGGTETTTLTVNNLPAHNHTAQLHGEAAVGDKVGTSGTMLAGSAAKPYAAPNPNDNHLMAAESITVGNTGANQGFSIEQPYQVVNYIIALDGVYPSRN